MKQTFTQTRKFFAIGLFLLALDSSANGQGKYGVRIGTSGKFDKYKSERYFLGLFLNIPIAPNMVIEPGLNVFPFGSETITTSDIETFALPITAGFNGMAKYDRVKLKSNSVLVNIPIFFAYRITVSDIFGLQFGVAPYINYHYAGNTSEYKENYIAFTINDHNGHPIEILPFFMYKSTESYKTYNTQDFGGMARIGLLAKGFSLNLDYSVYNSESKKAFDSKEVMISVGYNF